MYDSELKTDSHAWRHLDGLELADPDFLAADSVDILLGTDIYAIILQEDVRKGKFHQSVAQRTSLGWILSRAVDSPTTSNRALANVCSDEEDLSAFVRKFWQQEEVFSKDVSLDPENQKCEEFFRRTHSRTPEGRYLVRLLVLEPLPNLAATRQSALRVLLSMEKRFVYSKETRLQQMYKDFMKQYEDLDHMSLADPPTSRIDYLPHHGVMREASVSTKLRVVFNGSSPVPSGVSLNQHLMVRPNLDDVLTDAAILEEALTMKQQLVYLCMAGGFPLRKWLNDPALLADIPTKHCMQQETRAWRPHETHAILGLQWHSGTDCFSFATHLCGSDYEAFRSFFNVSPVRFSRVVSAHRRKR